MVRLGLAATGVTLPYALAYQAQCRGGILHCTRLNGADACDDKVKALSFPQDMYN